MAFNATEYYQKSIGGLELLRIHNSHVPQLRWRTGRLLGEKELASNSLLYVSRSYAGMKEAGL